MPRVLFLTASYPVPEHPLLGIFVKEHARAAALHADVAVLHLHRSHAHRGRPRLERVADDEFPTWRVTYPWSPVPLSAALHFVAAAVGWRAVRRSGFEPDLIHAHFFLAGVPAVLLARRRKPVVVTEQWSIFLPEDPLRLSPTLRRAARFAFGRASYVLPASEALRRGIESEGLRGRFRVVPNVVDTGLFRPNGDRPAGAPTLVAVGLLYEAKGYEVLLEALARVDRVPLAIVGDGPLRAELERLAAGLGIADRVTFHGMLPKPEVAALLGKADAFVLTSRYDNNPCAVIEALASGLPVLGTAVGGIPELIDDRNGLLARPGDPADVAERLRQLLGRLEEYDRPAIAARAGERFSRPRVGAELAEVYASALAEAARVA